MTDHQIVGKLKQALTGVARRVSPRVVERQELGKFAERLIAPLRDDGRADPFRPGPRLDCPGIDFDLEHQRELIGRLTRHRQVFEPLRDDPAINTLHRGGDRIRNGFYPTPDAEAYAAMIAETAPPMIIEVGGGFSTLIARATIDRLGLETELWVVDPEPRTDVRAAASRLSLSAVEDEGIPVDGLAPGSVLFIDSSHVLRAGGDVAYLYGRVLPALPPGVVVHVHDVFLPFDYTAFGVGQWWTEQYVLQALLSHSPRYRVELALRWLTETDPDLMVDFVGPAVTEDPAFGGGSIWLSVAG